ncbi:MAG: HD domain-containing protein [bacterium]|nr:HD domain-containing protein [bacterium]
MATVGGLKQGEQFDGFFRVRQLEERKTRAGKAYLDLLLEDRTGSVPAKVWEVGTQMQGSIERGDFVKVRALAEDYRGILQLRVQRIRAVNQKDYDEGFAPEDCIEQTPFDVEVMWEECRKIAESCHPDVAALLLSVFDTCADKIRTWPAAQRIHHPYLGGLLEHTLSVTKTCLYLADKYEISRDLLVAGALLHDIGKLDELSAATGGNYTVKGRLIGHVVLGRDILRDHAARLGQLPEEFLTLLEHLILSHQGLPEWGTVKVPMMPEALLLHYADDIDAKFNVMRRAILQNQSDEEFTERIPILARALYKLRPYLPQEERDGEEDGLPPGPPEAPPA